MLVSELLNVIGGKCTNDKDTNIPFKGISTSSKNIIEGNLFIALNGKKFDGHNFIEEAIQKGAAAVIVQKEFDLVASAPIIMVDDTYEVLMQIGKYFSDSFKGQMIAVTGSAGKTMTKELIYAILSKKYHCLKSEGNKNNHIGVPLTLSKLDDSIDIAILEVGMNHKGEISRLSKIIRPDMSVITNIGSSHIGNLGSKKQIWKAKMEIIDGMDGGYFVVNGDDKYLKKIKSDKVKVTKCQSDVLKKIEMHFDYTNFTYLYNHKEYDFTLNMPGAHLVKNCELAIKVGLIYGIPFEDMIDAIKNYKPLNNRLNIQKINNNVLIDDCYNSNYEAVVSLISYLKQIPKEKTIILGDILELGKFSKKIHLKIGKKLRKARFEHLIFIGKYMYYAHKKNKKSMYFKNNEDALNYLKKVNIENNVILIKGSRGMHLEQIVTYFNENVNS